MSSVKTPFSPQANGFRFVNSFELKLPVKFQLPFVGAVDLSEVTYGLCGGMCYSALDYFYAKQAPPTVDQVPAIEPKLFTYLCDRQLDSLGLPSLLKLMQWIVSGDGENGLRMARTEIPRLRRMLEQGNPAVLILVRVKALNEATLNHQVLATGYDYDPEAKQLAIHLYDPNHPGLEPTIEVNLNQPGGGVEISQSSGEFLRGFFINNYFRQTNVPVSASAAPGAPAPPGAPTAAARPAAAAGTPAGAVSFAAAAPMAMDFEAGGFALRWPVDSRRVNQYFGENPETYKPFGLPGHEGVDLYAPTSANVYAAADGQVYQVGQPPNHPYGLHIRIKHPVDGKTYHTIYAHLQDTFVSNGQNVAAGDLIGKANNTGNSFGSHLHLTLKLDGATTPGYPAGIIDPWPYLQGGEEPLPDASGLTVYTTVALNLRAGPSTDAGVRALLPSGEALSVLGEAAQVQALIGQQDQWLQVKTASGQAGYVAAWFVQPGGQPFPPSDLVVYADDSVNVKSAPTAAAEVLASLTSADPLTVLGDAENGRAKLGRQDQWLQVQTEAGARGFVEAWLVHATGQPENVSDLTVYAQGTANVYARQSSDSNVLTVAQAGDALRVLGDKNMAKGRIGQADQWVKVKVSQGVRGFVEATAVGLTPPAQKAQEEKLSELTVYPTVDINIRAQGSQNSPRVGGAFHKEALQVIEVDLAGAKARVGKANEWLHVQTKAGKSGWAAAWLLSLSAG